MIKLHRISKAFGRATVLIDLCLDIAKGEILVIKGTTGAGKTTLLRLIAGLEEPDSGDIFFNQVCVSTRGRVLEPHLRNLGFVMQEPALWPHMTVLQHLKFVLSNLPKNEILRRVDMVLAATDLEHLVDRRPAELSGGEAQRLSLARAFVKQAEILLLDEPLTHLNPENRTTMLELIDSYAREYAITVVYVSHHVEDAATIADRILTLDSGQFLAL